MENTASPSTHNPRASLAARFAAILDKLDEAQLARLNEQKDSFVDAVGELALKFAQPKPAAPPAHETIRIPCEIGGRNYVACGFLKAGESPVIGQVMLGRTQVESTRAIGDDEWAHLLEHRKDFRKFPKLEPYRLATERRRPGRPRFLGQFHPYFLARLDCSGGCFYL